MSNFSHIHRKSLMAKLIQNIVKNSQHFLLLYYFEKKNTDYVESNLYFKRINLSRITKQKSAVINKLFIN